MPVWIAVLLFALFCALFFVVLSRARRAEKERRALWVVGCVLSGLLALAAAGYSLLTLMLLWGIG